MRTFLLALGLVAGCGGGDDVTTQTGAATDPAIVGNWTLVSEGSAPVTWSETWTFGAGGEWARSWTAYSVYPAGAERGRWMATNGTLSIFGPGGINAGTGGYALVDCGRPAQCLRLSAGEVDTFAR
jgi:hypothetical protein